MTRVDALSELVDVVRVQPQRLAQVPDASLHPVGGDGAGERRALPAVPLVDPLDQLLPDVAREVEVYIEGAHAVVVDETVEGQAVLDGVDVGQADEVPNEHGDG